jgi:hypothetical protein
VPLTLNALTSNNTTGQTGWGGFGAFTYDPEDPSKLGPGAAGQYTAFTYDSLGSTGGDLLNGGGTGWNQSPNNEAPFDQLNGLVFDVTANDYPIFDRAGYGINFDPDLYKLEVVYKPLPTNEAPIFNITMDTYDGFHVEDRLIGPTMIPYPFGFGQGKRRAEQQQWGFGYNEITGNGTTGTGEDERGLTIQEYYDANPKDADGFVTISAPLTDGIGADNVVTPSEWWRFTGPSFMFASGAPDFFGFNGYPGDEEPDFGDFEDLTPNGVVQLHLQSAYIDTPDPDLTPEEQQEILDRVGRLHLEIKRISIVPINPDPSEVARLDAMSGIGRRFGSPFTTQTSDNGTDLDDNAFLHEGNLVVIRETDQLQRFDENGFTNLIINTDDDDQLGGFGIWGEPQVQTFDGTQATLEVRARLTAPLDANHADMIGVVINDLDGNDGAAGEGGEEYRYDIDLNQFNELTFETISIPLADFNQRQVAFELVNDGDMSLEDFNLYYLGVVIDQGTPGSAVPEIVVDLEIEFIRIVLPDVGGVAGDYNGNGVVDAADYTFWRDRLGQNITLPNSDPTDNDGMVTTTEYDFWKSRFGATSGAGSGALVSSQAVPEPGALALWLLATGMGMISSCRSR